MPAMLGAVVVKSLYQTLLGFSISMGATLLIYVIQMLLQDAPAIAMVLSFLLGAGAVGTLIYLVLPMVLVFPAKAHEGINPIEAIRRSYTLIRGHWWQTFGLSVLLTLILSFVQSLFVGSAVSITALAQSVTTLTFAYPILLSLIGLGANAVWHVGMGIQYFNCYEADEAFEDDNEVEDIGG